VPKTLVFIPAYNEAESIFSVVAETRASLPTADVLVVDDASTDATAQRAAEAGAEVVSLPFNVGIGGAVQTGYKFAATMGYDIVARLDGDGQHIPAQLPALIEPVARGEVDMAVGSRFLQGRGYDLLLRYHPPLTRSLGIKLFSTVVSAIVGQRLTDTTSGFRAANREVAAFYAHECPQDYPEVEGLISLHRAGFSICEVPVVMRDRIAGRSSITSVRAFYYVFKVLLAVLLSLIREPARRRES
jgi:glycosyltransferase involved in cell wall biosynthesis